MKFGDPAFTNSLRAAVRRAVQADPLLQRARRAARKVARRAFQLPSLYRVSLSLLGVAFVWAGPRPEAALIGFGAWWWTACVLFRAGGALGFLRQGPAWVHALAYPLAPELQWPHVERELLKGAAWTAAEFTVAFALVTAAYRSPLACATALSFGLTQGLLALGAVLAIGATLRSSWATRLTSAGVVTAATLLGSVWLGDKVAALHDGVTEPLKTVFGRFSPSGVISQLALRRQPLDLESAGVTVLLLGVLGAASFWAWHEYGDKALAAFHAQLETTNGDDLAAHDEEFPADRSPVPAATTGAVEARLREAFAEDPAARIADGNGVAARVLPRLDARGRLLLASVWRDLRSWQHEATRAAAIIAVSWAIQAVLALQSVDGAVPVQIFGGLLLLVVVVPFFNPHWRAFSPADVAARAAPRHAHLPVGYFELSRPILALDCVRAALAWPWLCLFGWLLGRDADLSFVAWAGLAALVTAAAVALQPLRIVFAFSHGSGDTRTFAGGMFALVFVLGGLAALFFTVVCVAVDGGRGGIAAALGLNAFGFSLWGVYGWLFNRARWDLIGAAR